MNWDEAAAERYRAANAEHRDRRQTYTGDRTNRHAVGQVLQRGDEVGTFRMAASQVGPRLFGGAKQAENSAAFLRAIGGRTEDEAAQVFRRRAVDENGAFDPQRFDAMMTARREALNGLKDYIATDLRAHAELNGRIDPGKYQRWLQQHRAALSDYPDVAAQFDTAAKASESLKLLEDARAQIDKAHPLAGVGELGSLPPRYWRQGPAGADWVRRYVQHTGGSPEAMATMDDYALSSLRDAAWRNGTWSNAGFANWERQFAPALAERPDLRAKLRTVADAQAALADQATKKAEALKQWQDSAARFWIGTDPDKAMSRLVSSRNPVVEAQDLVRLTKHDPAALAGVKRAAADWLMNRVREVAEAGTSGEKGVSKNSLQRIFEKNPTASGALRVLLGNDAMDVIGRVSRDMDRQARSWEATKIPASPGSAADHAALRKGANLPFMVQMFGAEFVSELATHLAGAHGTGGFLIAQAGAAGALVLNAMRVAGLRNMQELEAYALLDPQGLGRLVLSHASTPVAREALAHKLAKRLIQLSTSQAQLRHNTAVQR